MNKKNSPLRIYVAPVRDCPHGQRSNPFELETPDIYDIGWFIKSLNDEYVDIDNSFCFLVDESSNTELTGHDIGDFIERWKGKSDNKRESVIDGINKALDNGDIDPHEVIQIVRQKGNAVSFWQIEDIISRGEDQFDLSINPAQAKDILKGIDRNHDATIGINWTVLDEHIQEYDFEGDEEKLFDVFDYTENVIQRFLTEQQIEEAYPNFLYEGRTVLLDDTGETRVPGRVDANFVPLRVENGVSLCYAKETLAGSEFVTHKVKEQARTIELYWGHYFTDFDKAVADFESRQ